MSKQGVLEGMEKSLKELNVDTVRNFRIMSLTTYTDSFSRLTCIIFMLLILLHPLKRPCRQSRNCMLQASSSEYVTSFKT